MAHTSRKAHVGASWRNEASPARSPASGANSTGPPIRGTESAVSLQVHAPGRGESPICGPIRRPRASRWRLADALVVRLWDNVAVDGIVDGRDFGSEFVIREQSDLTDPLDAVPTGKRAAIDF